jgi:hypothetical protein
MDLAIATSDADVDGAVHSIRRAGQIPGVRGWIARMSDYLLTSMLIEAGYTAAAEDVCLAALGRARATDDQWNVASLLPRMADLDLRASSETAPVSREGGWSRLLAEVGDRSWVAAR